MLQKGDKREISVSRELRVIISTYKCTFQTRHLSFTAADGAAAQVKGRLLSKAPPHVPRTLKTCGRGRGVHLIKLGFSNL